jgi:hypothetical protein
MPAYTLPPSVGSWASNTDSSALSVSAPASSSGKLLVLVTANRAGAQSIAALTGWKQAAAVTDNGSLEVWLRYGDGSATDSPSVDWSGTNDSAAVILAYAGDVYVDVETIVAHANTYGVSSINTLPLPNFSGASVDNCLVLAVGRKNKTATSNDATTVSHSILNVRAQFIGTNVDQAIGVGDLQQTTATNYDGTDFTIDGTTESLSANGIVVYLRSASATRYVKVLAEAVAASETGIEGVVLNATRDTVIGEFSGQAFEASLESGEAVLLIPTADITPDGNTLTTSDTPIVFAYNATDSLIGPGSATVIEV